MIQKERIKRQKCDFWVWARNLGFTQSLKTKSSLVQDMGFTPHAAGSGPLYAFLGSVARLTSHRHLFRDILRLFFILGYWGWEV